MHSSLRLTAPSGYPHATTASASALTASDANKHDVNPLWTDEDDVSTLLFMLDPSAPETFLELDPADFLCNNSGKATPTASTGVEPSHEPYTDEIPWSDLVFWLGNASTGEVVCSCAKCCARLKLATKAGGCRGGLLRRRRMYAPYQQYHQLYATQQQQYLRHRHRHRRVSSKIPVINLPRIEGVN